MEDLKYLFGPVPSRRLGRSLGINVIPSKICSMNCVYCEVGRTKALSVSRKPYIKAADIERELRNNYHRFKDNIDVITLTGAGEPTMNSELPDILRAVKAISDKPAAILTNATLIGDPEVFGSLLDFDIVVPSLDAVTEENFRKINLPEKSVSVEKIIKSLKEFSLIYKGKLFLEILLCRGLNDSQEEIKAIAETISDMKPTKVQIGTVTRPPAFSHAQPVSDEALLETAKYFISWGIAAEATGSFKEAYKNAEDENDLKSLITALLKMRPCTLKDISAVFGTELSAVEDILKPLLENKTIFAENFGCERYFIHNSIAGLRTTANKE